MEVQKDYFPRGACRLATGVFLHKPMESLVGGYMQTPHQTFEAAQVEMAEVARLEGAGEFGSSPGRGAVKWFWSWYPYLPMC